MEYVNANHELPVYQVIGPVVRVHWDYQTREVSHDMDSESSETYTSYDCREAVVPINADRATFVNTVNAAGGDGESLADGWFD